MIKYGAIEKETFIASIAITAYFLYAGAFDREDPLWVLLLVTLISGFGSLVFVGLFLYFRQDQKHKREEHNKNATVMELLNGKRCEECWEQTHNAPANYGRAFSIAAIVIMFFHILRLQAVIDELRKSRGL